MHSDPDEAAGPRLAAAIAVTQTLLGVKEAPDFTTGTDVILPVSANQDLRKALAMDDVNPESQMHSYASYFYNYSEVLVSQVCTRSGLGCVVSVYCMWDGMCACVEGKEGWRNGGKYEEDRRFRQVV